MEGILERRPGRGTFVVSSGIINLTCDASKPARFFHLMQKLGVPHRFEVVEKAVVEADPDLCSHLDLAAEKRVVRLTLVLYADERPVIVERDYFPYDAFKRLMVLDISDPPLALLEREFDVKAKIVRQLISAVAAGEKEMALFRVEYPIPCIYQEWISCSADGRPFSVSLCHYRGDAFKFKIPSCELVRPDAI
jgi:GntR family transcriptional regulator